MKKHPILIFFAFACLPIHANTPKQEPLVKYTGLWTNSPFTARPVVVSSAPTVNPFEDFTLTGIAPVPGGHRITIINKKNPDIKRVIQPGGSDDFKIVSVNRNPEKSLGTTVTLSSGSVQGTVTFQPEFITLKTAPAAPVEEQQNILPPVDPPQNQNPQVQTGQRLPRPRIMPPPTPPANQPIQNQPSGQPRENRRR